METEQFLKLLFEKLKIECNIEHGHNNTFYIRTLSTSIYDIGYYPNVACFRHRCDSVVYLSDPKFERKLLQLLTPKDGMGGEIAIS